MLIDILVLLALAGKLEAASVQVLDSLQLSVGQQVHPPFSFAWSRNDTMLLADMDGLSLFRSNFTTVRVGELGRRKAVSTEDGFLVLGEEDGKLLLQLLGPLGDVLGEKSIPAASPRSFSLSLLASDRLAVVWDSLSSDSTGWGVSACLLTTSFDDVKCSFRVNAFTAGDQVSPCVGRLEGGFVTAWVSMGVEVGMKMQRFDLSGARDGAEQTVLPGSGFEGCYFVYGETVTLVVLRTNPVTLLTEMSTQSLSVFGHPLGQMTELPWVVPTSLVSMLASPILTLSDDSVLIALNVRRHQDDRQEAFLMKLGEAGCVYWSQGLSPSNLEETVAVGLLPVSETSAVVAYLTVTTDELHVSLYEWQGQVVCRRPSKPLSFPVPWHKLSLSGDQSQWKLIAVIVPLVGLFLVLALIAVMTKAYFLHKRRQLEVTAGHGTNSKSGQSIGSTIPLHFTEKPLHGPCEGSLTCEFGDISVNLQGTETSPVKSPTLGQATTD